MTCPWTIHQCTLGPDDRHHNIGSKQSSWQLLPGKERRINPAKMHCKTKRWGFSAALSTMMRLLEGEHAAKGGASLLLWEYRVVQRGAAVKSKDNELVVSLPARNSSDSIIQGADSSSAPSPVGSPVWLGLAVIMGQ